jgi:hypothetical protein
MYLIYGYWYQTRRYSAENLHNIGISQIGINKRELQNEKVTPTGTDSHFPLKILMWY